MKDIDFDELDRAVSSVLTSKDKKQATLEVVPEAEPSKLAAQQLEEKTSDKKDDAPKAVETVIVPSPSLSPSPAIRRSGRFMDVVHPSSDMSPASNAPVVAPVVRRPLVPLSDDVKPEPIEEVATPTPETSQSYPTLDTLPEESTPRTETAEEAPDSETAKATSSWPDPLDVDTSADAASKEENVEPTEDTEVEDDDTPAAEQPATDVSQTPFLSDTKVDKRPLGAFADTSNVGDVEPLPSADSIDPEDVSASNPADVPTVLPHELDAEVIALDANESEPEPELQSPVEKSASASTATPSTPVATSIPQQYRTETDRDEDEQHSVFDTNSYHQPLLPQKTHRHSRAWVWVLLIVGLLAVGAGLGALWFTAGY